MVLHSYTGEKSSPQRGCGEIEHGHLQLYGEEKLTTKRLRGNDPFKKPFPFRHINNSLNGDCTKCVYSFYYLLTIYM